MKDKEEKQKVEKWKLEKEEVKKKSVCLSLYSGAQTWSSALLLKGLCIRGLLQRSLLYV